MLTTECKTVAYWEGILTYFQAKGWADLERKVKRTYWTALKMNWKVWTPFQFINVNFVPVQVRVSLTSSHWVQDVQLPVLRILILCFCFLLFSSEYYLPIWWPFFGMHTLHLWESKTCLDIFRNKYFGGELRLLFISATVWLAFFFTISCNLLYKLY